MLTCVFCFCLCLVCFESRRQPLRLVEALDSLVLNLLRVFIGSLEEDLVFHMLAKVGTDSPEQCQSVVGYLHRCDCCTLP